MWTGEFFVALDMEISAKKSWFWSLRAEERAQLDRSLCQGKEVRTKLAETDLGVQMVYCKQTRAAKQCERIGMAQEKLTSISFLPLQPEQKAIYVKCGVFPQVLYGAEAMHYSDTWLDQLRTGVVRGVWHDTGHRLRSPWLVILLVGDVGLDPAFYILQVRVLKWRSWLARYPDREGVLQEILELKLTGKSTTRGPATLLLDALAQIGWQLNPSLELITHHGVSLHLLDTNLEGLMLELREAWVHFVSAKISGRAFRNVEENGGKKTKALRKGIRKLMQDLGTLDLDTSTAMPKKLDNQDRGLLRAIMTGAVRTEHEKAKCQEPGSIADGKCACGEEELALVHRWRWCTRWSKLRQPWQQTFEKFNDLPEVTQSYGLVNEDSQELEWRKRLWEIPTAGRAELAPGHRPDVGSQGEVCLDGSARPADLPRFRTASWGVVDLRGTDLDSGQTVGRPQTINRAELGALAAAIRKFEQLVASSDSSYVVKMFQKLATGCRMRAWPMTKNGDMWKEIEEAVKSRPRVSITVNKIKAHSAAQEGESMDERARRLGNDAADRLAKEAANGPGRRDNMRAMGDHLMRKAQNKADVVRKYQQMVLQVSRCSVEKVKPAGTKGNKLCVPQSMPAERWKAEKCWKFAIPILPNRQQNHFDFGRLTMERLRRYLNALVWTDPAEENEAALGDPGIAWSVLAVDFELSTGTDLPVNCGKGGKPLYKLKTEDRAAATLTPNLSDLGLTMQGAVCQYRRYFKEEIILAEDTRCSLMK